MGPGEPSLRVCGQPRGEVSVYAPPCSTTHFRGLVVCHVEMEKGRENPDWGLGVEEQGALNCVGI